MNVNIKIFGLLPKLLKENLYIKYDIEEKIEEQTKTETKHSRKNLINGLYLKIIINCSSEGLRGRSKI